MMKGARTMTIKQATKKVLLLISMVGDLMTRWDLRRPIMPSPPREPTARGELPAWRLLLGKQRGLRQ